MAMEAKKLLTQNSMDTILVLEFISLTLISAPNFIADQLPVY